MTVTTHNTFGLTAFNIKMSKGQQQQSAERSHHIMIEKEKTLTNVLGKALS